LQELRTAGCGADFTGTQQTGGRPHQPPQ